ncbi:hypothetical protein BST61_g5652 [Cercospora zeina]
MDSPLLSRSDVLTQSQTAWRISKVFAHGKDSSPVEFAEVDRELHSLGGALKLVAEALWEDGSILSRADDETRSAINTILLSIRQTLAALERFVDRYQVIQKTDTGHGFVVERVWSQIVLANYKTFKWTIQGSDIRELRKLLEMYTTCTESIIQALQSRSQERLAEIVVPIALTIAPVREKRSGGLGEVLDEVHRSVVGICNGTPYLEAERSRIESPSSRASPSISKSLTTDKSMRKDCKSHERDSVTAIQGQIPHCRSRDFDITSAHASSTANFTSDRNLTTCDDSQQATKVVRTGDSTPPPKPLHSISESRDLCASPQDSAYEGYSSSRNSWRRDSATLPPALFQAGENELRATASSNQAVGTKESIAPPIPIKSKERSMPPPLLPRRAAQLTEHNFRPPPVIGSIKDNMHVANPPIRVSPKERIEQGGIKQRSPDGQPIAKTAYQKPIHLEAHNTTGSRNFERHLLRNAAILCDVRGRLFEYAHHKTEVTDIRYNVDMKSACKECRILIIRKRENRKHGGTKVATSVWCLSDDDETRIQQGLSESQETVPYCSYFEPEKVSLQGQMKEEGGQLFLKFHGKEWGAMLEAERSTNWVNYYFTTEADAVAFQSAVFGRMLLGSFRTTKTTVIHEGIKGAFTFEEQFANIEMLRLWEDDGVETPGAAGGVMALMHISSNFGEGWARWWINNSLQHVRIKEDGGRFVKVKGINIAVARPGATMRQAERAKIASLGGVVNTKAAEKDAVLKKVGGIKIEFKSEEEKDRFVAAAKVAQTRSLPLPEF